jgi:hypothetical protein
VGGATRSRSKAQLFPVGVGDPRYHLVLTVAALQEGKVGWVATATTCGMRTRPPNKRMKLTKLRAAPVWQAEVPPCAPAGTLDGGTASQLIRSVRWTRGGEGSCRSARRYGHHTESGAERTFLQSPGLSGEFRTLQLGLGISLGVSP